MIERKVRDFLRAVDDIRDRVDMGTGLPGIYAGTVPTRHRGECILLSVVGAQHNNHLAGESSARHSVVQVSCYGENAERAYTLAELVRNRLSGYSGSLGDTDATDAHCVVQNAIGAQEEPTSDASDKWTHSYTVDYFITHQTPVPTLS